jgi:hypothetical protein
MEDRNQTERNKAVIRRFVEEVQNGKDFDVYDELNDPDFVNLSSPPGVPSDRERGKLFLQAFAQAYPDATFTIDTMIAEGEQVVTKKTMSGLANPAGRSPDPVQRGGWDGSRLVVSSTRTSGWLELSGQVVGARFFSRRP